VRSLRLLPLLLLLLALPRPAASAVYTWVDEQGVTHIVDDPAALPEAARGAAREGRHEVRGLWDDGVVGPRPESDSRRGGVEEERLRRLLRGAIEDLERGETARASVALESVLRRDPSRPEAHWYLALLSRQRGRYASAEAHLRAFLAAAGERYDPWRRAAERKLEALEDERRLADASQLSGEDVWLTLSHPHFEVHFDAELARSSDGYPATVLRYLEQAHAALAQRLGAVPAEPLGVKFYGKAAYLRAHRHRFSFQTVGFFDGRIHVVSAAHPAGELRALLFHEYTHAIFRETTGGDRPFWLNEGLAELSERGSRQQPGLSRSERSSLKRRIDAGDWIPLRRLAPSFSGLEDGDARAAYLIATAAAVWLEQRTDGAQRGRLLALLGSGARDDEALDAVIGLDTAALDAAVREWIRGEFAGGAPAGGLRSLVELPTRLEE
jgi:hypothetical protein